MLARTLKSAVELGLNEIEYNALVRTLHALEDGEIKEELFKMKTWHQCGPCGTTHCFAGWANHFDNRAFPELTPIMEQQLSPLKHFCIVSNATMLMQRRVPKTLQKVFGLESPMTQCESVEYGAAVLRKYLETGEYCGPTYDPTGVRWPELL